MLHVALFPSQMTVQSSGVSFVISCCNSGCEEQRSLTPSEAIYGPVCIIMHSNCSSNSPHRRCVFTPWRCLTCRTTSQKIAAHHVWIPPLVWGGITRRDSKTTKKRKNRKEIKAPRRRNTQSLKHHPVTAFMLSVRDPDSLEGRDGGGESSLIYRRWGGFARPCL